LRLDRIGSLMFQPISECTGRTDLNVTTGQVQNQGYFPDVNVVLRHHNLCENDGLQCCNKLPGNNLDFATGPCTSK